MIETDLDDTYTDASLKVSFEISRDAAGSLFLERPERQERESAGSGKGGGSRPGQP